MSNTDKQPTFKKSGENPFDFWTVNGHKNWAVLPSAITGFATELPIRLQVGNSKFGYTHIMERHSRWVEKNSHDALEGLLWKKLGQMGKVHTDHNDDSKRTLTMAIVPLGILVLRKVGGKNDEFLTVVTLYGSNNFRNIDGYLIGRYKSEYRIDPDTPVAAAKKSKLEAKAQAPKVTYKKKRR